MNIRYPIYEGVYRILTFQFRGKGSGTARFHLQGRALQVSGKIILAMLWYFPRKPCLWRRSAYWPLKLEMACFTF